LLGPPRKGFIALPETLLLPFPSAFSASDSGLDLRTEIGGREGVRLPVSAQFPTGRVFTGLEVAGGFQPFQSGFVDIGERFPAEGGGGRWEKETFH